MYRRLDLFATNVTYWCRSPNYVRVLILSNEIRIQDGKCHAEAIKTTCHTPCDMECEKFLGASVHQCR